MRNKWVSHRLKRDRLISKPQVAEKVRGLLMDRLGLLPGAPLFLDTEPFFHLVPSKAVSKGVKYYYFSWHEPETDEERRERESALSFPEHLTISMTNGDIFVQRVNDWCVRQRVSRGA